MAKRTSSRQFVTVFVSLILSFGVKAADLTIGDQPGIDRSKGQRANGLYEKAIGEKIA
jgi:taurine transport system substrate-binding protein